MWVGGISMKKVVILVSIICLLGVLTLFFFLRGGKEENLFPNFVGEKKEVVEKYAKDNKLKIIYEEEYSDEEKGTVIKQNKEEGSKLDVTEEIIITISLGEVPAEVYRRHKVDELGRVPIMMYHGIHNMRDSETQHVGGNVDKDGYQRTAEAFRRDLELYYRKGYRMIRLEDYVNGKIDVALGYSPIILTFDDGHSTNIRVTGRDENGKIIIDPNSAVGILEEFKTKYPDFNVTATFFLNGSLFQQKEYNEDILKWLVANGYDIGNHSYGHANFNNISYDNVVKEVATMYQKLDEVIPGGYINVVALPFGYPNNGHKNFPAVLSGNFNGYSYNTVAALRAGWESDLSPFNPSFNKTFIKRIRAYDNRGNDFDIEYAMSVLDSTRYISDGDINQITVPSSKKDKIGETYGLKIRTY